MAALLGILGAAGGAEALGALGGVMGGASGGGGGLLSGLFGGGGGGAAASGGLGGGAPVGPYPSAGGGPGASPGLSLPSTFQPASGSASALGIPGVGGTGAGTGAGIGPMRPTSTVPSMGERMGMGDLMPASSSAGLGTSMGGPAAPLGGGSPFASLFGGQQQALGSDQLGQGGAEKGLVRRYLEARLGLGPTREEQMMQLIRQLVLANRGGQGGMG